MNKHTKQERSIRVRTAGTLAMVRTVYAFGWLIVAVAVRSGFMEPKLEILTYASQVSPWLFVGWGVYASGYALATILIWQSKLWLAATIYVLSYILNAFVWFAFTSFALTLVYGITPVSISDMVTTTIDLGLIALLAIILLDRNLLQREAY